MNRKKVTRKLSIVAAASVLALTAIAPAFASSASDYGVWSEPALNADSGSYSGTISFAGTTIPAATYETVFSVPGDSNEVEVRGTSEEWISEGTPFGAEFGSNGSSATNNFLRTGVTSTEAPYVSATTTITFESPVPAESLGIVIADLDVDSVTVSAKSADETALTGDQLVGSASPVGFNMCDTDKNVPTICEDVEDPKDIPVVTKNANDAFLINSEVGEDVGVSAWMKPSAEISTLTVVHTGVGSTSTVRIVLAGPTIPTLADTGSTQSDLFGLAAALMILGAISVVHSRRVRNN